MRTTIEIDEKLLDEAVRLTREKNRGRAVNKVLADYVRRQKIDELRAALGTIDLSDEWKQARQVDMERQAQLAKLWEEPLERNED